METDRKEPANTVKISLMAKQRLADMASADGLPQSVLLHLLIKAEWERRQHTYVTPPAVTNWLKDATEKLAIGNPPFEAEQEEKA